MRGRNVSNGTCLISGSPDIRSPYQQPQGLGDKEIQLKKVEGIVYRIFQTLPAYEILNIVFPPINPYFQAPPAVNQIHDHDDVPATRTLLNLNPSLTHLPVALALFSRYLCSMASRLCPLVSDMKNAISTVQRRVEKAKR